jgi:hypothetical protein
MLGTQCIHLRRGAGVDMINRCVWHAQLQGALPVSFIQQGSPKHTTAIIKIALQHTMPLADPWSPPAPQTHATHPRLSSEACCAQAHMRHST